jgi:hypothetical protein
MQQPDNLKTPPRARRTETLVCPGAPGRPGRPVWLKYGGFRLPDPGLTLRERRRYILSELNRWLLDPAVIHAAVVMATVSCDDDDFRLPLDTNRPEARLCLLDHIIRDIDAEHSCEQPRIRLMSVARLAIRVCEMYLRGHRLPKFFQHIACGFVAEDLLPCGYTIADLWEQPKVADVAPQELWRQLPDSDSDDTPETAITETESDTSEPAPAEPQSQDPDDGVSTDFCVGATMVALSAYITMIILILCGIRPLN